MHNGESWHEIYRDTPANEDTKEEIKMQSLKAKIQNSCDSRNNHVDEIPLGRAASIRDNSSRFRKRSGDIMKKAFMDDKYPRVGKMAMGGICYGITGSIELVARATIAFKQLASIFKKY
jgi:hypothetical protein